MTIIAVIFFVSTCISIYFIWGVRKRARLEKMKMDAMLSSMNEGLIAFNSQSKIIIMNQAAGILARVAPGDALGKEVDSVLTLYKGDKRVDNKNYPVRKAMIEGIYNIKIVDDYYLVDKNGRKIPITMSAVVLTGVEHPSGFKGILLFKDITIEKQVDRAKTEFVSLASHQLRTPLAAINWYAEMLLDGDAGKLGEKQKKYVNEIYGGSQRMVELVNALLNVSRLEVGTFTVEPEPIDVIALAKSVVGELRSQINKKQIKFEEHYENDLLMFNADPKLLRMVFQNLLSNAVKYMPDGGRVGINISVLKPGDNFDGKKAEEKSIAISVEDNGYGITYSQQNKIFSKLFRADNILEKDTEGTGLGLYIVKAIVDHSDGHIWFNSKENKGTTFYVLLPMTGMKKKEGTKTL